jgi:hypothetical protein
LTLNITQDTGSIVQTKLETAQTAKWWKKYQPVLSVATEDDRTMSRFFAAAFVALEASALALYPQAKRNRLAKVP